MGHRDPTASELEPAVGLAQPIGQQSGPCHMTSHCDSLLHMLITN